MKQPIPSLKPFGAWVTDLTDKYRHNPFTQAQVNIVVLQVLLTLILIGVTGWAIQYEQQNTVGTIVRHREQIAAMGTSSVPQTLPQAIESVHQQTLEYVFLALIAATAIIGYLMARFALLPTKNSLQFQKRFIGNVAHEIRTPLAIIKTSTEVALMDPHLSSDMRETFQSTIEELDRISETINNLLSFDTLINPSKIRLETVDMRLIAQSVVEKHAALAQSRGVTLALETHGTASVIGNATAFDQLITNLVKNAINYTPAHTDGKVIIRLENDTRNKVSLSIADTGIGIAENDLYHVLEPFYRGDSSRARGVGTGTSGLGLAIVNEIVRLYHGTLTIKSTLGRGTTITVAFPRAPSGIRSRSAKDDAQAYEVVADFS